MEINLSKEDIQQIAISVANILKPTVEKAIPKKEQCFTLEEVAALTKQKKQTVKKHIDAKLLAAKKLGKNWIITETNLNKYIKP